MPYSLPYKIKLLAFACLFHVIYCAVSSGWAAETSDLVVHFETNGRELNALDRNRLKKVFETADLIPESKILVVGYTDSTGTTNANYALSRHRANTVKSYLLGLLKLDKTRIIAVGRGAEAPVAPNDTPKNRAFNRRAEIFILGKPGAVIMTVKTPSPPMPPPPPDPKNYMDLLKEAQRLVKIAAYDPALVILKKAQAKGAEHHSLYHLLYGIIGYFQGIETNQLITYFEKARQLDAHSLDALDFWGRAKARHYFESGLILADKGRTAATAIKVETISQEYEFMRLFEVRPLQRKRIPNLPIDIWQCQTSDMTTIEYFFDISAAHQWAFSPAHQDKSEGGIDDR